MYGKKRWEGRRPFEVKGLPAFENNSHANTVTVVLSCLNSKTLNFCGPNQCFYLGI